MRSRRHALKTRLPLGNGSDTITNLFAITDVAAVAEEIIDGVFVGQVYEDIGSSGIADGVPGSSKHPERRLNSGAAAGSRRSAVKDVELVLDIAPDDYTFTTQPGALKRVSRATQIPQSKGYPLFFKLVFCSEMLLV